MTATSTRRESRARPRHNATWTLTDVYGDTRTVVTRFVEQSAAQAPHRGASPRVSCTLGGHSSIACKVTYYPKAHKTKGTLRVRVTPGGTLVALGHGVLRHGAASLTMRLRGHVGSGPWAITLVLAESHGAASTTSMRLPLS